MRFAAISGWWYGRAEDAGTQLDMPRALGGRGDEHLGRGDRLPPGAMVLANPGFIEPEVVEPLDKLQVALQGQGWGFPPASGTDPGKSRTSSAPVTPSSCASSARPDRSRNRLAVVPPHYSLCAALPCTSVVLGDLCVTRHSRASWNPRPPAAAGGPQGGWGVRSEPHRRRLPLSADIASPLRVLYTRRQAAPPAQPATGLPWSMV